MNDAVDALDSFKKPPGALEITNFNKRQISHILGSCLDHQLAFGQGTSCASYIDTLSQESIDDMGADEAGGPCHQNSLSEVGGKRTRAFTIN